MTDEGEAATRRTWLWLPVATSAVLTMVMFVVGRASDPRSARAGAEPDIAGVVVALPFAVLFVVALVAACIAHDASSGVHVSALTTVSTLAVLVAALVVPSRDVGSRRVGLNG